ncbi:MAG: toll/interleukin-1 receptor domain-containing protein [bacterium]
MLYDVFICHASEDKDSFVRQLADALTAENVAVWYDEFSLKLGDSIRMALDKGLRHSRYGVVVMSNAFFKKKWPQYELDGLAEREMTGNEKVLLPVWYGISHDDVMKFSPSLANRKAVSAKEGMETVVKSILKVIHPKGSPLLIARDTLIEWGLKPPVVTDEYWLNIIEASNRHPGYGPRVPKESSWKRWSFPLPQKDLGPRAWGERLAWTAMQLNWTQAADKIPISPMTPSDEMHNFINSYPGLHETCAAFPELLAEYAPQLTIRSLSGDLDKPIEKAYLKSCAKAENNREGGSTYGSALTVTGKSPLCDEEWALRHPTYGDYQADIVSHAYFHGGVFGPSVSPYEDTDHCIWLLSSASAWLPRQIRAILLKGALDFHSWPWGYMRTNNREKWATNGTLSKALYHAAEGKRFRWTKEIEDDVLHRLRHSKRILRLPESSLSLLQRFREVDFPGRWVESERRLKKRQNSRESTTKRCPRTRR